MKKQPSKTNWENIEKEFDERFVEYLDEQRIVQVLTNDHCQDIKDFFCQKHEALIKELGDEIEKMDEEMTFEEANKKAIEPDDYLFGHQEALSDIKEILKRYND